MADVDFSKIKRKKVAISLSVDESNLKFLKEDLEKYNKEFGDSLALSSVFDMMLRDFVGKIKKSREDIQTKPEKNNINTSKEEENKKEDDRQKD
ncbi:hypothetical protein KAT36_00590 [Candidatus Pacearchaeota archaeon]|nr:hypothetical protein [Candidatus Pacearchaeota archaeon]